MGAASSTEGARCYFVRDDDSMFDSIINNVGLVLTDETFELTWRQRYEEDLFHVATIETVQMRGSCTVAAGPGGEDMLTLTFDPKRTTGTSRFENNFINVMMLGVRVVTRQWSPKPLAEPIPDAQALLRSSTEDTSSTQHAELEFYVVSANNKQNQLRVGDKLTLKMNCLSPADLNIYMALFQIS